MGDLVAIERSTALTAMTEAELVDVLQSSLYPGAALKSIKMVIGYCKAANLDPMQKPVHIVPMWDKNAKAMRDVIMPGVGLYRTQAARSNSLAGIGEPEFGPTVEFPLDGVKFSAPEWCRVVVKRMLSNGSVGEFAAIEYWIENYATAGKDSIQPNAMWKKRPRGQLAKCAQAQALRMAFPEMTGSAPTADEMEGKHIDQAEIDITPKTDQALATKWVAAANSAIDADALAATWKAGVKEIKDAKDMIAYEAFKATVTTKGETLKVGSIKKTNAPEPSTEKAIDAFDAGLDGTEDYIPE